MDAQLFSQLIQFSWTLTALIFAGQGWVFLQEFKGNRVLKARHWVLGLAFGSNVVATAATFWMLSLVLDESLSETKNYVAENIKLSRSVFVWAIGIGFVLTAVAAVAWLEGKNQKEVAK